MCRWDDDYAWMVECESEVIAEADTRCEDCGRTVPAGELVVQFVPSREGQEDIPYATVVHDSTLRWWSEGEPYHLVADGWMDQTTSEAFEALGFECEEVPDWRVPGEPNHYCCRQCRAADLWLQEVCSQVVVLTTVTDLDAHLDEYTDEQLGPDFVTLATMARRQWRTKEFGTIIPVDVVDRWAHDAVAYAMATGLHPE